MMETILTYWKWEPWLMRVTLSFNWRAAHADWLILYLSWTDDWRVTGGVWRQAERVGNDAKSGDEKLESSTFLGFWNFRLFPNRSYIYERDFHFFPLFFEISTVFFQTEITDEVFFLCSQYYFSCELFFHFLCFFSRICHVFYVETLFSLTRLFFFLPVCVTVCGILFFSFFFKRQFFYRSNKFCFFL